MGEEGPSIGAFAIPKRAVPTEVREASIQLDVPTGATIEELVVVMGRPRTGVVPACPLLGPAVIPTTEIPAFASVDLFAWAQTLLRNVSKLLKNYCWFVFNPIFYLRFWILLAERSYFLRALRLPPQVPEMVRL